jgi:membrane-associated protein
MDPVSLLALGPDWIQPEYLIETYGLIAVLIVVFVECGLFLFFLPGDSLLFATGVFVGSGVITQPIGVVIALIAAAAILGNLCGYAIGRAVGPQLFDRPDSRLLRPDHVAQAHTFFERHGGRSIVLARFVPIVRTFITALAGVAKMDARAYVTYTVIGGVLWATSLTLLGFWLGNVTWVADNIELIAILIVAVSVVPIGVEYLRARRGRAAASSDQASPDGD